MINSIHQHNIGTVSVNFDSVVYDTSGFFNDSNIISHKMRTGQSQIRNIENYYSKYPGQDIYLLQEVQGGPINDEKIYNFGNGDKYYYFYTKTGHLFYSDENEIQYPPINHGCAVLFNANKYKLIGGLEIENKRNRTSKFILFTDTFTIYAVLSVHGEIISNFNDKFLNRLKSFYEGITKAMLKINSFYNMHIEFIIGGDFNINLFKPNFNPFNQIKQKLFNEEESKYIKIINNFLLFLKKNNINFIDFPNDTNYNIDSKFNEKVDFL